MGLHIQAGARSDSWDMFGPRMQVEAYLNKEGPRDHNFFLKNNKNKKR